MTLSIGLNHRINSFQGDNETWRNRHSYGVDVRDHRRNAIDGGWKQQMRPYNTLRFNSRWADLRDVLRIQHHTHTFEATASSTWKLRRLSPRWLRIAFSCEENLSIYRMNALRSSLASVVVSLGALACSGSGSSAAMATAGPVQPASAGGRAVSACSQEYSVPVERFLGSPGMRGVVVSRGRRVEGWALFDTGASSTRVRDAQHCTGVDTWMDVRAEFRFGGFSDTVNTASYSPALCRFIGPAAIDDHSGTEGAQVATVGTDLIRGWSVRLTDDRLYFSHDDQACSGQVLASDGFIRLDSSGFYQRGSGREIVIRPANIQAPTVPTVNARLLGITAKAQIDTGLQSQSNRTVHVNSLLFEQIRARVGAQTGCVRYDTQYLNEYRPRDGTVEFVADHASRAMPAVGDIIVVHKTPGQGGIAEWTIPAMQISPSILHDSFSAVEFRSDQAAVWVQPRRSGILTASPPTPPGACPSDAGIVTRQ